MTIRRALLLVLFCGCSFQSAEPVATFGNRCGGDADCGGGICSGGICVDDSNATVELAFEVVAASAEAQRLIPASWAFAEEDVAGSSTRAFVLPAIREVLGTVRWQGLRVPATLRFVRRMPSEFEPLAPVPVEVETFREAAGGDGPESYDFSALLVAGEAYDVVVLPTSDMVMSPMDASAPAIRSLPPLYLETEVEGGDPAEPFRFDVSFPEDLERACTEGEPTRCTLEAIVLSVDGEMVTPEPDLQVRAIDPTTGRVLSSIGETDDTGSFAIRVGDVSPGYLLRITSRVDGEPFPAVSVDPEVALSENPFEQIIRIPRIPPVQFRGKVRDERGSAVPSATLRFSSTAVFGEEQLGLQGSFTASATTQGDGSFLAVLLPGFYDITVTPPEDADDRWGILTAEALVGDGDPEPEPLVLPVRYAFSGVISTFQGEAAAGVAVDARARSSVELSTMHRSQDTVSDADGLFTMGMDLGLYDVLLKTPPESGYAWQVEPGLLVEAALTRSYVLELPLPIEGFVEASDGTRVPGALIRAYVLASENGSDRPIQVAETTSDEEGDYRLLISPVLGGR